MKAAQRRKHKHGKIIATSPEAGGSVPGHPDWTACGPAFTAASRFGAFPFPVMKLHDYLSEVAFIAYSPTIGKMFTPHAAILLCWVIWKTKDRGQHVEATVGQITEETGLSERNIETAKLKLENVLVVTQKRLEHRTFYSVNAEALEAKWNEFRESTKRTLERTDEPSCPESTKRTLELDKRTIVRTIEQPPTPLAGGIALGASTPRKRCPKSAEPSPEAKALIQEFASIYGRHFRSSYVPNAKRDVPGANALVLAGVTVDELRTRADAAMRSKAFNCKRATTLALLAELWNNVGAELQDGQRTDNTMQRYETDFELPMLK